MIRKGDGVPPLRKTRVDRNKGNEIYGNPGKEMIYDT